MAKAKYILLVPLSYNDKTKVPKRVLDQILEELFRLADGYHIAGTGKGAYRMASGKKQLDRTLDVWVVIDEDQEAALKEMMGRFGRLLGQESMYFERTDSAIEFIPPKEEES